MCACIQIKNVKLFKWLTNKITMTWCNMWCEKIMSITLHLTCVILPHGVSM
jgi:hypothetical protein